MVKKKYNYIHSSYMGSYIIPCKVLDEYEINWLNKIEKAKIQYIDPISEEKIEKIVLKCSLIERP